MSQLQNEQHTSSYSALFGVPILSDPLFGGQVGDDGSTPLPSVGADAPAPKLGPHNTVRNQAEYDSLWQSLQESVHDYSMLCIDYELRQAEIKMIGQMSKVYETRIKEILGVLDLDGIRCPDGREFVRDPLKGKKKPDGEDYAATICRLVRDSVLVPNVPVTADLLPQFLEAEAMKDLESNLAQRRAASALAPADYKVKNKPKSEQLAAVFRRLEGRAAET